MLTRIGFVLAIVLCPVAALAQALADRLPADTVAYVGWSGPDAQAKAYEGSHLKAILESSQLRETFTQFLPKVIEQAMKAQPDAAEQMGAAMEVFNSSFVAYKHPFAYAFTGISWDDPDHPMPKFIFLCEAGDDVETVYKTVKAQFNGPTTKPLADAGFPIRVARFDTLVVGTIGYDQAKDALVGGKGAAAAKSLAMAPKFKSALATAGKVPAVVVYANVAEVLKIVDAGVKKVNDPQAVDMWPKMRDALGLGGMNGFLFATGFDGKDWGSTVFIDAPAPRKGLLSLIESRPLSNEILKAIPQDATSVAVTGFDASKLISAARESMATINPNAAQQVDQILDAVDQQIGMSLEKDVLGSLGTEWGYYSSPSVGGDGMLGAIVVNQLRDPVKFEKALDKATEMGNAMLDQNAPPDMKFRVKETKAGTMRLRYFGLPIVTPAWGIQGGRLYAGLSPQAVASAAAANKVGAKSILDNPKFIALRDRLGAANPSGIVYSDLRYTAPAAYPIWQAASRAVGLGELVGVDSPAMVLPPLSVVMENLAPAGSVTWTDDAGFHVKSISPFPGSELLASDPLSQLTMGQGALATSVLLPALNRAREQGNRVKSASNLRQIGLAVQMHANENKGKFPTTMDQLLKQDLTPEVFVNPRTSTSTPPRDVDPAELAKWVDESSDYVYIGAGKNYTAGADEIIAYEKPDGLSDGINLLFADGHVEFEVMPQAMDLIEKSKMKKPAAKPKGIPKNVTPPAPVDGGL